MNEVTPASLLFVGRVREAFSFLTSDYGFCIVATDSTFVRYESSLVFINVYYGRNSYELGVEIGRLDETNNIDRSFQLVELVCLQDEKACQDFKAYQTTDVHVISKGLVLLATALRQFGRGALCGDIRVFETLHQVRKQSRHEFARELRVSEARAKAEAAWKIQDYATSAFFYSQLGDTLSNAEIRKLSYAHKKLLEIEKSS